MEQNVFEVKKRSNKREKSFESMITGFKSDAREDSTNRRVVSSLYKENSKLPQCKPT